MRRRFSTRRRVDEPTDPPHGNGRAHRPLRALGIHFQRRPLRRISGRLARLRAACKWSPAGRTQLQVPPPARHFRGRSGRAERPRLRGRGGPGGTEPQGDAGRAVRRARGAQPEPLAVARVRPLRGERCRVTAAPGRVLLQDIHVARLVVAVLRALHSQGGGAWPGAGRARSRPLRPPLRLLRRARGRGRTGRSDGGDDRGAFRRTCHRDRRRTGARRQPPRVCVLGRRRRGDRVRVPYLRGARFESERARSDPHQRIRVLRRQHGCRSGAAHRPRSGAGCPPPAPAGVVDSREGGGAGDRRHRAAARVRGERSIRGHSCLRRANVRAPVWRPARTPRGGVHQQRFGVRGDRAATGCRYGGRRGGGRPRRRSRRRCGRSSRSVSESSSFREVS